MRPGRLGEIFDDAGDVVVAFDQQHVAGLRASAQRVGIARRERLVAAARASADSGRSRAQRRRAACSCGPPAAARFCRVLSSLRAFYAKAACNLVHTAITDDQAEPQPSLFARRAPFGQSRDKAAQAFGNHAATEPPLVSRRLGGAGGTTRGRRDGARSGQRRRRDRRCRRGRHRRGAPHRRGRTQVRADRGDRSYRRPLRRPIRASSACPTTAARIGSTCPTSIR